MQPREFHLYSICLEIGDHFPRQMICLAQLIDLFIFTKTCELNKTKTFGFITNQIRIWDIIGTFETAYLETFLIFQPLTATKNIFFSQ